MCWVSKVKPVKQYAYDDIVVYKVLIEWEGVLCSPYVLSFTWKLNTIYESNLNYPELHIKRFSRGLTYPFRYEIYEGFHSCARGYTLNEYYLVIMNAHPSAEIYECIIPKGSYYYKNSRGEYVSDKLIIKNNLI